LKRENDVIDAIDYQIPVNQLSVLGAFRECDGDRYIQVAKRLFRRTHNLFAYNLLMNDPN